MPLIESLHPKDVATENRSFMYWRMRRFLPKIYVCIATLLYFENLTKKYT